MKQYRTNYLFPKTSLLSGVGSVLNLSGNYYRFRTFTTAEEADIEALKADWGVVAEDIKEAISSLDKEIEHR